MVDPLQWELEQIERRLVEIDAKLRELNPDLQKVAEELRDVEQRLDYLATAVPCSDTPVVAEATAKELAGLRSQMELKNRKLVEAGESKRFENIDQDILVAVENMDSARARGYPYVFPDQATFDEFKHMLIIGLTELGYPVDDIHIQGSSVYRPGAKDVDIMIRLQPDAYTRVVQTAFTNTKGNLPNPSSALERTRQKALATGKLDANRPKPKLSGLKEALAIFLKKSLPASNSIDVSELVDLSVIQAGSEFDIEPLFKL